MRFALLALYATIASAVKLEHMLQAATDANAIETALATLGSAETGSAGAGPDDLPEDARAFVALGASFDIPEETT